MFVTHKFDSFVNPVVISYFAWTMGKGHSCLYVQAKGAFAPHSSELEKLIQYGLCSRFCPFPSPMEIKKWTQNNVKIIFWPPSRILTLPPGRNPADTHESRTGWAYHSAVKWLLLVTNSGVVMIKVGTLPLEQPKPWIIMLCKYY